MLSTSGTVSRFEWLISGGAQDCTQEAFLHAFERRHQLRDPVAFPLWFHRIVTRHILDAYRGIQRGKEAPLEIADELNEDWGRNQMLQPDEAVISAEEYAQLWQNVQLLPPLYRIPLVLRYYGDFSLREVAELMGKREGTIRVTIHRALQQLRILSQPSMKNLTAVLLNTSIVKDRTGQSMQLLRAVAITCGSSDSYGWPLRCYIQMVTPHPLVTSKKLELTWDVTDAILVYHTPPLSRTSISIKGHWHFHITLDFHSGHYMPAYNNQI